LKLAIFWFRRDLRLADNPALLAALDAAEAVVPVYLWSPEDEVEWAPGAAARWWLISCPVAFAPIRRGVLNSIIACGCIHIFVSVCPRVCNVPHVWRIAILMIPRDGR
jgi:hypothetical protein